MQTLKSPRSHTNLLRSLYPAAALLFSPVLSEAQITVYWDANGSTSGTGGTGTWNTSSVLWRQGTTSGTLIAYPNTGGMTTANLSGTVGTITVASGTTVNVNNLTIASGSAAGNHWHVNSADNTAFINLDGSNPIISTASNPSFIDANLTGTSGFTKLGGATITLGGDNSGLSGDIIWDATGTLTLSVGSDTALGTGTLRAKSVTNTNGTFILQSTDATTRNLGNDIVFGGTLVLGSGPDNTGNMVLGNLIHNNTNSQGITVNSAWATAKSITVTGTNTFAKNGTGDLIVNGNYSQTGATVLTIDTGVMAVGGTYSNTAPINLANAATVSKFGRNGTINGALNTANSLRWTSGVSGGLFAYGLNPEWGNAANNLVVNFGGAGASQTWGSTTNFISNGATFYLGDNLSNGTVDFQNAINLNGAVRTVNVEKGDTNTKNGSDAKLSGALSNGGLTKEGNGKLELSGVSNYTGATTVSAGTLLVSGTLGATTITVADGAALEATGTFGGNILIQAGGTLAPGSSPGLMNTSGNVTLADLSNFNFELIANSVADRGINYDAVNITGAGMLQIGANVTANLIFNTATSSVNFYDMFWETDQTWLVFSYNDDQYDVLDPVFGVVNIGLDFYGNDFNVTGGSFAWVAQTDGLYLAYTAPVVPEPSSAALVGLGIGLALLRHRRA